MWRPWRKSTGRIHTTTATTATTKTAASNFSCSSFKDIQHLYSEDSPSQTTTTTAAVKASVFHRVRVATVILRAWSHPPRKNAPPPPPPLEQQPPPPEQQSPTITPPPLATSPPGADKRIVIYFTSLRVVRPTFEDCRTVRSIIRGFRVTIDERDLSMDSRFLQELQGILGEKNLTLPRVFIGGRYIGGAEEILQLHESGELKKYVGELPPAEFGVCDGCGGYRFILCDKCSGSCKCYSEKIGFRSCTVCNENGLIRCPSCFCGPL